MKILYPTKFRYKGKESILLWQEGREYEDRFLLDGGGNLIKGETIEELRELADRAGISAFADWSYDYTVNMDEFTVALIQLIPEQEIPTETCDLLLNGWNILNDLLITVNLPRTYEDQNNEDINHSYERIFWGNNLEALTPPGESWHPEFSKDEILSIQELFMSILATLEQKQVI